MKPRLRHRWDLSPRDARALQQRLRRLVLHRGNGRRPRQVAGIDVAFDTARAATRAAVVVVALPTLEPIQHAVASVATRFPYVPGLLSFREIPAILAALAKLRPERGLPELLLCDGQGYAHPRRFGLACHLGVLFDLPSIGVAKSRLIGEHGPVPAERGRWTALYDGDERIGAVLRTRPGVRPLFVSTGHRISIHAAVRRVMECVTRFRIPETTRLADRLAATP